MQTIPVMKKEDFSIWKIPFLVRGYRQSIKRINNGKISRDRTFRIYDKANKFLGYSSPDIVMPVSNSDAVRVTKFLLDLEDRRFYLHHGVDFHSVMRAAFRNIQAGRIVQGGSTLSMQLVRNTLIETNRTFLRKGIEMVLSRKIEKKFSKQEILRLYCEQVFMGKHIRGIQSASFFIYRKPIAKLNDEEIFGLLGMLRAPQKFSPYQSQDTYRTRQKVICKILKGTTSKNRRQINPVRINVQAYPHIARTALRKSDSIITDKSTVIRRVGTSLDFALQKHVNHLIGNASKLTNSAISAIVVENKTGSILAESSWQAGVRTDFSPIIEGVIRPGSTYKTFALIAALEQGYSLDMKLLSAPFYHQETSNGSKNTPWIVRNYNGIYKGEISLRDALVFSDNAVFARLTTLLDHEKLFAVYRRFGLLGDAIPYPSVVLGAVRGGINPINLVTAYQAIANNGVIRAGGTALTKYIEFDDGGLSWEAGKQIEDTKIVIDSEHVLPIQNALQAAACSYGLPHLKGKTGTTSQGGILVAFGEKATSFICQARQRIIFSKENQTVFNLLGKLTDLH